VIEPVVGPEPGKPDAVRRDLELRPLRDAHRAIRRHPGELVRRRQSVGGLDLFIAGRGDTASILIERYDYITAAFRRNYTSKRKKPIRGPPRPNAELGTNLLGQ
jgi:hypothetical protein